MKNIVECLKEFFAYIFQVQRPMQYAQCIAQRCFPDHICQKQCGKIHRGLKLDGAIGDFAEPL